MSEFRVKKLTKLDVML